MDFINDRCNVIKCVAWRRGLLGRRMVVVNSGIVWADSCFGYIRRKLEGARPIVTVSICGGSGTHSAR